MITLPQYFPTSTEISLITGKTEIYNASGTLQSFETHIYSLPFLVYIALVIPTIFIFSRIIKEFIKRF